MFHLDRCRQTLPDIEKMSKWIFYKREESSAPQSTSAFLAPDSKWILSN